MLKRPRRGAARLLNAGCSMVSFLVAMAWITTSGQRQPGASIWMLRRVPA